MQSPHKASHVTLPRIHEVLPEHFAAPRHSEEKVNATLFTQVDETGPLAANKCQDATSPYSARRVVEVSEDPSIQRHYLHSPPLVGDNRSHRSATSAVDQAGRSSHEILAALDLPAIPFRHVRSTASIVTGVPYPLSSLITWSPYQRSAPRPRGRGREDDKKHQCPYCPKRFNRPSSLATHINIHTGARPYECPKCGRLFSVNSNMRRHYRNHEADVIPGFLPSPYFLGGHPYSYLPYAPSSSTTPPQSPESGLSSSRIDSDHDEPLWAPSYGRGFRAFRKGFSAPSSSSPPLRSEDDTGSIRYNRFMNYRTTSFVGPASV